MSHLDVFDFNTDLEQSLFDFNTDLEKSLFDFNIDLEQSLEIFAPSVTHSIYQLTSLSGFNNHLIVHKCD